jgi:hypothetical protein
MADEQKPQDTIIPCCPELIKDDHCDVINFSRVLNYPTTVTAASNRRVTVEVILRFKFSRCTLGLTLGDPVFSTTLLPGEKLKLSTTDRRSRFTYDSETKLSYRSEQISEEQYYMTAVQKYMADASAAQSGQAENSSDSKWDFHGDAGGSINPFSLSASASTKAGGSHNSHSVSDYLNEQKSHVQSSAMQAANATHKAHAVSIGEVSSRTNIEGTSEEHFEASSREFSNYNKCHAVTYMFYRLNKKQKIKFELISIERRVLDDNAPIGGILQPTDKKIPIALVPQDIPATVTIKKATELAAVGNFNANSAGLQFASYSAAVSPNVFNRSTSFLSDSNFGTPIDGTVRESALKQVDEELIAKNLIDRTGKVTNETKQQIEFESELSLPTPGIIVKGCLDDCDVCEPLVKERMQLENDLLRKQIDLLEKSQEYRCCPPAPVIND